MPLTNDEIVSLSDNIWELLQTIEDIRKAGSANGKKLSKSEARRLLRVILKLAGKLAVDIID